jgi:hypothetical protein
MRRALFALLLAGCATAPTVATFDRCNTGRVIDGCSPADLPPLEAMLPPWPFPSLVEVQEAPKPAADSVGKRWLEKVAK